MTFAEWLTKMGACTEAVEWVGDRTPEVAWAACPRAEWLLWLVRRLEVADRWVCADLARLFAAEALAAVGAETWAMEMRALPPVVDADTAAQTEFWCCAAAEAASCASYAAAADAASYAAAADAAEAASCASFAAYAAAADGGRMTDLVRARIPFPADALQRALR